MAGVLLIVDDHMGSLELARLTLPEVEMVTVTDADAAKAAFADHEFNLVLLDQDLGPGKFGHEICRWIRDQGSNVVILALSSSSKLSDRDAFDAADADGFLRKSDFTDAKPMITLLAEGRRLPEGQRLVQVFNDRIQA